MEHFKVGQEKVSALKTVAIKLEVSNKRINDKSLKLSTPDLVLSLDLWSPQSLLPSHISGVSNEETQRGGVKAGISGQGWSLGEVSPFYFFLRPHLTLTPVVGQLAKIFLKISSSKIRSKIEEKNA